MITFLTILQVLAAILLVAFILIQPAKNSGNAFGPSEQSIAGQSAGTSSPFKMTMIAAAFLGISSLFVNWSSINEGNTSVIDELEVPLDQNMAPDLGTTTSTSEDAAPAQENTTDAPAN